MLQCHLCSSPFSLPITSVTLYASPPSPRFEAPHLPPARPLKVKMHVRHCCLHCCALWCSYRSSGHACMYCMHAQFFFYISKLGWDVRPIAVGGPIAVGDVLRRLASKCACSMLHPKVSEFFQPYQYGVGVLKKLSTISGTVLIHIRIIQTLLSSCPGQHFPELLPWVSWCYGQHPNLWVNKHRVPVYRVLYSLLPIIQSLDNDLVYTV